MSGTRRPPGSPAGLAGIADVRVQVVVRHLLPARRSTAALNTALGTVRDFLDSRSFVLRNNRRTDLALGLIRLHLNGADLQSLHHTLLRQHLAATGGVLPPRRDGKDTGAGLPHGGGLRVDRPVAARGVLSDTDPTEDDMNNLYITASIRTSTERRTSGTRWSSSTSTRFARHRRHRGADVRVQSGTDDHAIKNISAADAAGYRRHRPGCRQRRAVYRARQSAERAHLCVPAATRATPPP